MKRTITFLAFALTFNSYLIAQHHRENNFPPTETFTPSSRSESRSGQESLKNPATPQFANDITIENVPATDQRHVRISVAFNGWLYAAFSTYNAAANSGGITIRKSTDNGFTWTTLDSYSSVGVEYPTFDIVVAGTSTASLTLYLIGVNHNTGSGNYILFLDRYDGNTGSFLGSNYNLQNGTRTIYDVSIASDYRSPSISSSPYSVAFLYSTYTSSMDSIVYIASLDGGSTWSQRQSVMTTGYYCRTVSLAYGQSSSGSNGRYFAAWETLNAPASRNGHIYFSRTISSPSSAWIPPVNLDSVSASMINLCRNPSIATMFNSAIDSDSGGVAAVITVDRDYAGDGSDYDVLGFYNMRAHFTNYWYRFDVSNTGITNDMHSDITFDPGYNNFLLTYMDSTGGKLPYIVHGLNFTAANSGSWINITPQYNDVTGNIHHAYPRVEINPVLTQTAHAWIAEGPGNNGVAMFDAEYSVTSVNNISGQGGIEHTTVFPNPANDKFGFSFSIASKQEVTISVYNSAGQITEVRNLGELENGNFIESFETGEWAPGLYFVRIDAGNQSVSKRLIIAH